MDEEAYFSGDEVWDQTLVQALEQTGDYFSGDEVYEQAMVQTLDQLEEEDWERAMVQSVDQAERQAAWEKESRRKKSIIPIKNDLCCARAIVTMRAWCHRNDPGIMPWNNWNTLRQGHPRQAIQARELHRLAGVAEGPCGLQELEVFQRYLSPHYQLKVLSRHQPLIIIFRGADAPHLIMLLKGGNHYEGCTTFSGFLKKNRYWCHLCDKEIGNKRKHACQRQT